MQELLFSDMTKMLEGLERQQSALGDLVGRIHGESLATAANLGTTLKKQVDAAASGFADVTASQTVAMNERFTAVLSTQQSAFTELEAKVGGVVSALGQADRALASSARHLETSAQQLAAAQSTTNHAFAGAMGIVSAVRGSAEALNQNTTNSQAFLEQAKRIVHEAMEQADREAELTRQLQAV